MCIEIFNLQILSNSRRQEWLFPLGIETRDALSFSHEEKD